MRDNCGDKTTTILNFHLLLLQSASHSSTLLTSSARCCCVVVVIAVVVSGVQVFCCCVVAGNRLARSNTSFSGTFSFYREKVADLQNGIWPLWPFLSCQNLNIVVV